MFNKSIENEEDHKKAEGAVCSFLEKADQTYKQQQQMKAGLEVHSFITLIYLLHMSKLDFITLNFTLDHVAVH